MTRGRDLRLILLAAGLALVLAAMAAVALTLFKGRWLAMPDTPATVRVTEGAPPLTHPETRAAFDRWRTELAVGVFAVSPSTEDYFHAAGYVTLDAARRVALLECGRIAGAACRIYATLAPAGYHDHDGPIANEVLRADLATTAARPGFRAVAISTYGYWGMSWNHDTPFAAIRKALAECRGAQAKMPLRDDIPDTCAIYRLGY